MFKSKRRIVQILSLVMFLSVSAVAQNESKKESPQGIPVLWEDVNIGSQNLYLGPGGNAMRPNLRKITFIEEEKGGYSKKYRIKDGSGRVWVAKIGKEAQSETAAVRLIWALGYKTEINYLVPKMTIPGKGTFTNVRLEARPKEIKRLDEWKWKENPFVEKNEYHGLIVMMALLNNWDLKDSNNKILFVQNENNELHYIISDLGATFGKTGNIPLLWRLQRSRNDPADYSEATFLKKVKEGHVDFNYGGKMRELFDDITVEQARWIANLLSQLSDEQISDAFRAANYTRAEIKMLTQSVKNRISELNRVTGSNQLESKRNE